MKNPKRFMGARHLALLFVIAIFSMIGWTVLRQSPHAESRQHGDSRHSVMRTKPGQSQPASPRHHSKQSESPPPLSVLRQQGAEIMAPSQVAGREFPEVDLDALAFQLPPDEFEVYERMREEFPHVDWTEIEPTHQAFLDKRNQLPLNLNDEQREAYANWLGDAGPVSEALVRLRAEGLGLSANGMENGRGYYIDGFRDGEPVYVVTSNVGAAETTGVKFVRMNPAFDPALGDTVNGGELYVNINDHGTIYEHTEFQLPNLGGSRILYKEVNDAGSRDHMTHVAGTVAAWGYNSGLQGMAPRAWIRSFIQQSTWDITTYGMATPGQQMAEVNPRTGRQQLRSVAGNTSLGTSTPYNRYDSSSASYDSAMRDYPYYMHFNSSGNSGSGYETLTGGWKIAKNMISLGNASGVSRNADGAYTGGGDISSSSSRGPTYDGRINPDFAAKGSSVNSTTGETGSAYYSGTSMASPNATGSVTLLMDYVRQRLPQQYLRSSTYRALLAITADDRGNPGPDYIYGWGILNMHAAAKIVRQQAENTSQRLILEESLAPNQTWREPYDSDGTRPIRVSISWLDPAGAASADGDRSSRLVNDLDLRLIGPGGTEYKPYVMPFTTGQGSTPAFDGSLYGANAVQGDNITDPIEQVYIAAPTAGAYIVQVKHKGTLKDNQAQPFSVAVSGLSTSSGVVPASPVAFAEVVTQNGLLSPGEDVAATVSLINHSKTTVNNVVARITCSDPNLTIVSDTVSYGNLATGQSSNGNGALRIRLAAGASPRVVPLTLTVTTSSTGGPWVYPVTCAFVNPTAISGYVKTALGSPIAGATVSWTGTRSGKVTSGANGSYAIPEVDGTYQVTVSAPGYISRPPVSLTVPPYRTQDFLLDFYDLAVSPTTLSLQASGGQTASAPLRLTNTGSLPVNWSIASNAYRFVTSAQAGGPAYVWNDISTTGTLVTGLADDTNLGPFPLGFSMPFYGQNFTGIRVCSNGWLSFTSTATTYSTGALPNSAMPDNLIAPLMRDLKLTTAGTVHYQQMDADTFVVQFTNAPRYSNAASLCTFQVVLKRDGTITFYYQRADDPTTGLVGVQNAAKTAGLTVVHNQALIQPNMAIRIQPAWLSVSPASGTVAVGAVTNVTVTSNAAGLSDGTYQANLVVNSNDSNSPAQNVSVSLVVSNSPVLVTVWPTASSIVQGQPLSASTLTGGSSAVPGTFAFNAPSTVLAVGTHSVPVTFTPADTTAYDPVQGSVSVTVTPANAAPVANAQSVTTPQGTAKAITLTASDANGDPLTYAIVSQPTRGTLSGTPPNVTYTPSAGYSGSDSFTFKVNDGKVDSVAATVSIAVTPVNTAPVAIAQSVSTPQATAKAITLTGSDANGDPLTYAIVSQPANGALSGTPPNVTYTPSPSFSGSDSFTFKVNDGKVDSASATVSITVTPVNNAPVAVAQSVSMQQGSAKAITLAGSDANGDPLTYAIVSQPANGALSGTPPNVIYTPSPSYSGSDSFTFKVNDGKVDSAPATVMIQVTSQTGSIVITCDNGFELYLNGTLVGTGNVWEQSRQFTNLPFVAGPNVIAVKGTDAGGAAALLAELSINGQRSGTSTAWKVSLTAPVGWNNISFNDSGWAAAKDYGAYGISPWSKRVSGMPGDTPGRWIWSSNNNSDNTVYFRHVFNVGSVDTITPTYTTRADGKTVATFTSGSGIWTIPQGVSSMEVLVLGGGGAGGGQTSGGGAGGIYQNTTCPVTPGTQMSVSVGTGGVGGPGSGYTYRPGTSGELSRFGNLIAYGGVFGGSYGAGGAQGGHSINGGSTIVPGQPGGGGVSGNYAAGGGAGAPGGNTNNSAGGVGVQNAITGTLKYYAGGGGANPSGLGGLGGGGSGVGYTSTNPSDMDGIDGLGGGGGGGWGGVNNGADGGGDGGDGIVIVAYQTPTSQSSESDPVVEPAPAEIFAEWAACFDEGFSGRPDADDDRDGMNNFHEFAFGLNPTSEHSCNPIVSGIDATTHTFRYTRNLASGLKYTVWTSTNLVKWDGPAEVDENVSLPDANGVVTVEATLKSPPEGGNLFIRVKAD